MRPRLGRHFAESVVLFLFGPVIAIVHFMLVYLVAEAACAGGGLPFEALGLAGVPFVTVAVTLVAAGVTLAVARRAYRRRRGGHGDLTFIGSLLGVLFAVAILFVGVPPAFLRSC